MKLAAVLISLTAANLMINEALRVGGLQAGEALAGSDHRHGVAFAGAAAQAFDGAGDADGGDDPAGAVADRC